MVKRRPYIETTLINHHIYQSSTKPNLVAKSNLGLDLDVTGKILTNAFLKYCSWWHMAWILSVVTL